MNFAIDQDVHALADSIGEFLQQRCATTAVVDGAARGTAGDRDRWAMLCGMGLPLLLTPEPAGIGASLLAATVLAERIGAALLPEPAVSTMVLAAAWHRHAPDSPLLTEFLDATRIAVFNPFDELRMSTTGNVTGAALIPRDDITDLVAVIASIDDGQSALAVLATAEFGAAPTPVRSADPLHPTVTVELDTAPVTSLAMPRAQAERLRDEITLLTLAELVGGMDEVVAQTVRYVTDRQQFGRSIGTFQAIKHRLADMYAATEQARAAVQFAAVDCAASDPPARREVAAAARWVPRAAIGLFESAVHLHGAMGYSWEVPVHLYLRRAMAVREQLNGSAAVGATR